MPFAQGAAKVVNAAGLIAGTGTSYTLTITNTGDEPIRCFALFTPPGTTATAIQAPAGWVAGVSSSGSAFGGRPSSSTAR